MDIHSNQSLDNGMEDEEDSVPTLPTNATNQERLDFEAQLMQRLATKEPNPDARQLMLPPNYIFKTIKKYAQKFGKSFSKIFVSKRKIEEKNARLQIRIMSMQIAKRAMMESHMVTAS